MSTCKTMENTELGSRSQSVGFKTNAKPQITAGYWMQFKIIMYKHWLIAVKTLLLLFFKKYNDLNARAGE